MTNDTTELTRAALLLQLAEMRERAETAERAVEELLAERLASQPRSSATLGEIAEAARRVRAWRCPNCGGAGTIRGAERVNEYVLHITCDNCKTEDSARMGKSGQSE